VKDKIKRWMTVDPDARLKELQLFFRQYSRLLTFYVDKKNQLEKKITLSAWQKNNG